MFTYFGKVCDKHPELKGERAKDRNCLECKRLKVNSWKLANRPRLPKLSEEEKSARRRAKKRTDYLKYQLTKIQRVPAWADLDKIRAIYLEAQKKGMVVDHIIPLRGNSVCGLHVENNLRIISNEENLEKSNRIIEGLIYA